MLLQSMTSAGDDAVGSAASPQLAVCGASFATFSLESLTPSTAALLPTSHWSQHQQPPATMANVQQTQAFYALTLEAPSAPTAAVLCNVIPGLKTGDQQIFEARGQRVLLHRITESADRTERKITTVCDQDAFGIIRGVAAFRIPATATGKHLQIHRLEFA